MARYVQPGKAIEYTNASEETIRYGDVVALTNCIGVASADIAPGETGVIELSGVYEMPADTSAAFTQGQKLYWDASGKKVTATEGDVAAGIAVEAKEEACALALVKL